MQHLPTINHACWCCGIPISIANTNITAPITCGACIKQKPPYNKAIVPYHYLPPLSYLISGLKFGGKLTHAKLLGHLLAVHLQQHYSSHQKPQIIIPIPLHKTRLKARGYNQAVELARPIAKLLKLPIDKHSCVRIRNTQAQSLLKSLERKQNVQKAFAVSEDLAKRYQHVAVLDDVITTGNTVRSFCSQLQQIGVSNIDIWSCARASVHAIAPK